MARWADVVIADYNYYFDFTALLYGLGQANQWQVGTLVDEAHNLVERARQMYSASLDQQSLNRVRQNAPPALDKPFKRLNREWNAFLGFIRSERLQISALVERFDGHLQRSEGAIVVVALDPRQSVDQLRIAHHLGEQIERRSAFVHIAQAAQ